MTWTDEAVAIVREHWGNGLSAADIGKLIGCSRCAVIGKASRLGLARLPRKLPDPLARRERDRIRKQVKRALLRGEPVVLPRSPEQWLGPPVGLLELNQTHCRFPIDGENGETFYCGGPRPDKRAYCDYHHRIAHV